MDIVKQKSTNWRIHFFRNTHHPEWYFVSKDYDKRANDFVLKSHHFPPHENSGYEDLPIEWAFALEFANANAEQFLNFIRYEKGTKHIDEQQRVRNWIGDNGWYEFTDIKNTDKWLNDFYDFQNQRIEEIQKANRNGMQTTMF